MNARRKGARFEYRVRDVLKGFGFSVFKNSNSAFPDLFTVKKVGCVPVVHFVECKVNKYLSNEEKEAFYSLKKITGGYCFVAYPVREGKRVLVRFDEVYRPKGNSKKQREPLVLEENKNYYFLRDGTRAEK